MRRLLLIAAFLCHAVLARAEVRLDGGPCLPFRANVVWSEVQVEVENTGPGEVQGFLEAEIALRRDKGPRAMRPVTLAAGSKKMFSLLLNTSSCWQGDLEFRVRDSRDRVVARLRQQHKWLPGSQRTFVVAGASEQPAILRMIPDERLSTLQLARAVVPLSRFPEHPEGWRSAALVAIAGGNLSSMTEAQIEALKGWVRTGGELLVIPGNEPGWFEQKAVQALVPSGKVTEGGPATGLATALGGRVPGRLWTFENPGVSPEGAWKDSAAAWELGQGGIRMLRVDTSLPEMRGAALPDEGSISGLEVQVREKRVQDLGLELVSKMKRKPDPWAAYVELGGSYRWRAFTDAMGEGVTTYPSTGWLVLALLLFIAVVGPVNFLMLRKRHRPALTVVTVPILGALMTTILIAGGWFASETRMLAGRVTVLESVRGSSQALVREHVVLVAGRRREETVNSSLGQPAPMNDGHGNQRLDTLMGGPEGDTLVWPFEPREPACFHAIGTRELGPITAELDGDKLTIVNESTLTLRSARWIQTYGGRRTLEDIPAGATRVIDIKAKQPILPPQEEAPPTHEKSVLGALENLIADGGTPTVIALVDRPTKEASSEILVSGKPIQMTQDTTIVLIQVRIVKK